MLPSPYGCRLGPRGYSLSRPQRVHFCYGPVTRNLPWGDLVDRLQSFSFHHLCYPNYGALTSTPAGLSPAEHASLTWTHNRTGTSRFTRLPMFSRSSQTANGFASSTELLPSPVGLGSRLNNAAPSVQSHYRTFNPTTDHSVPVPRIGTLVLLVFANWTSPFASGRQVLTFRTRAWPGFALPTCRMPLGQASGPPPN